MKKLLYVATRQFWPATTGHETILYHNCKGLHDEFGYDIYLFCFADKHTDRSIPAPDFIKELIYTDVPSKLTAVNNALIHSFAGKGKWPLQNDLYYSKNIEKSLENYYIKIKPDVLVVDMVRLVPYIAAFRDESIKKILIAEDDLAKRYKRQIESSDVGNAAGYYSSNMSVIANKMISMKTIKNLILKMEISRLNSYEKNLKDNFDYITYVSSVEANEYNERYNTNKAVTLTMGADVEYYSEEINARKKKKTLAFVGNYTYAPNADSIEWICREIIPKLDKDVLFYVIGKCPDELKQKIQSEQVIVLGFVDDIREVVKSVEVYLSPITYGTGIKTKIIEAMAMGVPVVTNSVGAESLSVTSGKELFIANGIDEIVNCVNTLFENEALRNNIGAAGQTFVKEHHSWKKVYEAFEIMGL